MYIAYVLYSERIRRYYYGYTSDIKKRIRHHNLGLDQWSKRGLPWRLVYKEEFVNKKEAIIREKFFKSGKGREYIRAEVAKLVTARV